jgi:hypothetical protein
MSSISSAPQGEVGQSHLSRAISHHYRKRAFFVHHLAIFTRHSGFGHFVQHGFGQLLRSAHCAICSCHYYRWGSRDSFAIFCLSAVAHLFIMSITTDVMLLLFQRYGPPLQDVVRDLETGRCDINLLKDSLIGMHATFILDGCDMPLPCRLSFHLFLVHILNEEMLAINMGDVRSLNLRGVPEDAWDTIFERALDICLDHTSGVVVPYGSRAPHHRPIYASVMAVVRLSIDMYHADTARRVSRARPASCSASPEVRDTARVDDVLLDDGRATRGRDPASTTAHRTPSVSFDLPSGRPTAGRTDAPPVSSSSTDSSHRDAYELSVSHPAGAYRFHAHGTRATHASAPSTESIDAEPVLGTPGLAPTASPLPEPLVSSAEFDSRVAAAVAARVDAAVAMALRARGVSPPPTGSISPGRGSPFDEPPPSPPRGLDLKGLTLEVAVRECLADHFMTQPAWYGCSPAPGRVDGSTSSPVAWSTLLHQVCIQLLKGREFNTRSQTFSNPVSPKQANKNDGDLDDDN